MSIFNEVLCFLTEKIIIRGVYFGTIPPYINNKFDVDDNDEIYTFFVHEDQVVVVSYTKSSKSLNFGLMERTGPNLHISKSEISFRYMQSFYGEVLYVFKKMCEEFNITEFIIYSDPYETKTAKIYDTFSKNAHMLSLVKSLGFNYYKVYNTKQDDRTFKIHQFSKIKSSKRVFKNKKK